MELLDPWSYFISLVNILKIEIIDKFVGFETAVLGKAGNLCFPPGAAMTESWVRSDREVATTTNRNISELSQIFLRDFDRGVRKGKELKKQFKSPNYYYTTIGHGY